MPISEGFKILEKGAFIINDILPKMINFQFNPESITITKTLEGNTKSGTSDFELFTYKYLGEKFSIKLMLDSGEYSLSKQSSGDGIVPILAALEEMMDPVEVKSNVTSSGHRYPPKAFPQVIFTWGLDRILPVKIEGISVDEKKYDNKLVPISAEVTVDLKLLIPDLAAGMEDELVYAYKWAKMQQKKNSLKYHLG